MAKTSVSVSTFVSRHHGLRFVHVRSAKWHVCSFIKPWHVIFVCASKSIYTFLVFTGVWLAGTKTFLVIASMYVLYNTGMLPSRLMFSDLMLESSGG